MRGDEVQEVRPDRMLPTNPLYLPNKTIHVQLEFSSDDLSVNEVLALFSDDLREHLVGIHVRDRRFE